MEYDRFDISAEAIPELHDLTAATGILWSAAASATPNQYPGFVVTHDGERAEFTMHHSPTTHDRVALYRDTDGVWCVEEQRQRPTTEDQGFGQFLRTTITNPLLPGAKPTRVVEQTNPASAGEFMVESWAENPNGLNADGCKRLLDTLRVIRGEKLDPPTPEVSRAPRLRGLLAKIGAILR
jgi:hypothetical protein